MYRMALRPLPYSMYLILDLICLAAGSYLIFSDLVLRDFSLNWTLIGVVIISAFLHSAEIMWRLPHILFRSCIVGLVIFGLGWVLAALTNLQFTPAVFAAIAASAHNLQRGEAITHVLYRQQALRASAKASECGKSAVASA